MAKAERPEIVGMRPGDRIAIVAGSGQLPVDLAENLTQRGLSPLVVMLEGEAGESLAAFDHETIALEDFPNFIAVLKKHQITHAILAGGIGRRPRLRDLRPSLALLKLIPRALVALRRGDDGLLRAIAGEVESKGIKIVGAHEVMPDLLATEGTITEAAPTKRDWADIRAAHEAAHAIGALDIGQAAIAIGGRAIALEGIEGTDGLLERTAAMRSHGRLGGKKRGVLVKCSKPGQEQRLDLPTIGPATVSGAHAAGLAGIAVEAGRSLILDFAGVVAEAKRHGLFVIGLPRDDLS